MLAAFFFFNVLYDGIPLFFGYFDLNLHRKMTYKNNNEL
ncbi:hypothetical protein [Acinetobacter bereziniae]|nr:hypothetical protein [Acinetobacter bereziniae]